MVDARRVHCLQDRIGGIQLDLKACGLRRALRLDTEV